MREKLADRVGRRGRFTATYSGERTRTSHGHPITMALFRNVCDETGTEVTDHVHFTYSLSWRRAHLIPGDRVTFEATVRTYWKGYHDERRMDYRLSHPGKIRKLDQAKNGAAPGPTAQLRLF